MVNKKEYSQMVKTTSKNSELLVNCAKAFLIGGAICLLGQLLMSWYMYMGAEQKDSRIYVSVALVFLGVLLTALHLYDDIAKHAGAGTLVPITGFANSIASPAIEFKTEGFVTGVGAKMFVIAGPVIVYGTGASVVYGVIYYITTLF